VDDPTPIKRFRQIPMSYAAAAKENTTIDTNTDESKETVSSVTSADLDRLFDKMKKYVAGNTDTSGLNIGDLEVKISQSTKEVQEVRDQLSATVATLTTRVDSLADDLQRHNSKLSDDIQRQNVIILGMQQQFQDTMSEFSQKLQSMYKVANSEPNYVSPSASTSKPGQWGDQVK
jgi:hypothetical protein